jgi:hypothetical protein
MAKRRKKSKPAEEEGFVETSELETTEEGFVETPEPETNENVSNVEQETNVDFNGKVLLNNIFIFVANLYRFSVPAGYSVTFNTVDKIGKNCSVTDFYKDSLRIIKADNDKVILKNVTLRSVDIIKNKPIIKYN